MAPKTSQLQIRVSPGQKRRLRRLAAAAGRDVSTYVLDRVLPGEATTFAALVGQLASARDASFVFAGVHDLLRSLVPAEFRAATEHADVRTLAPVEANYLAAMIEHTAAGHGVDAPAWTHDIAPLDHPWFASSIKKLRLHLLRASPTAFKRRNVFVDATIGARV